MGSKPIAQEAEGWMGYWLRGQEGKKNNPFSKIQLDGQKYRDKTTLASKTRFSHNCFMFQFSKPALFATNGPSSSSTDQNAALMIDH